jgi:hypothetical protein
MCRRGIRVELRKFGDCKGNVKARVNWQVVEGTSDMLIVLCVAHFVTRLCFEEWWEISSGQPTDCASRSPKSAHFN